MCERRRIGRIKERRRESRVGGRVRSNKNFNSCIELYFGNL